MKNHRHSLNYWIIEGRAYQLLKRIPFVSYERRKYGNKRILSVEEGAIQLINGIESESPFLAGRFGAVECNTVVNYLRIKEGKLDSYGHNISKLTNNAGFFPDDVAMVNKYSELALDHWKDIDLLCTMNSMGEGYIVENYCKNAMLTKLPAIDPLITGWTSALADKKVLVIHPFSNTIEKQYFNKRTQIFPETSILPEFELKTIKAIQTAAGERDDRFSSWFDALDYMTDEALKTEFDVALIGCGAYGLPLGARIKRAGKKAIHMGGCLQLLFGIRGERWDARPEYLQMVNDAWVRPDNTEKPKGSDLVEGGCYW